MSNHFNPQAGEAVGQLVYQQAHRKSPTYVKAQDLVNKFISRKVSQRSKPVVLTRDQYDGFVLYTANALGQLGANQDPTRLFRMDGWSSEDLARRIADDEATVTKGAFAVFFSQVMATYFDMFEKVQFEKLVTFGTMDAPSAYFVHENETYTSTTGFYDQNDTIVDNLDPSYGRGITECAVAPTVGLTTRTETISVVTYRYGSKYSFEAEQDYGAVYGRNLPGRLNETMGTLHQRNLQAEHINDLLDDASWSASWDATPAGVYATLDPKAHFGTLYSDAILAVSLDMEESISVRRPGDFVAGGPAALQYFDKQLEHRKLPNGVLFNSGSIATSTDIDASFVGGLEVAKFELFPRNQLLVMARGDGRRPVRVHASYGPSLVTFTPHTDPTRGCTDLGIAARLAMKTMLPDALGVVDITPAT